MEQTIRSFIAIEIPEGIKSGIERYTSRLREFAPKLKWVKPDALHITLKFLGEQTPQRTEQLVTSLFEIINKTEPFQIGIKNFGAFPNMKRPRVFWLGIEASPRETFFGLFSNIEQVLKTIGFEPEQRKFSPHLTLARVKFPDNFTELVDFANSNPFREEQFQVRDFVLIRSILKPSGSDYRVIQKYPLRS